MRVSEAATLLGMEKQHVRLLIRSGRLRATKKSIKSSGKKIYYWDISEKEVRRFSLIPQVNGRPRGSKQPVSILHLLRPKGYRDTSILSQHLGKGGSNNGNKPRRKSRKAGKAS